MKTQTQFTESQWAKPWWVWLVFLFVNGLFFYGFYKQIILGQQFGDKPMNNTELYFTMGITLLISVFALLTRVDTVINKEGVFVRFFPIQLKYKSHPWETISKAYIRKYKPLLEYGGWGYRMGNFKKGRAYNMSGNIGLQLEFNDKKRLLIGTVNPEELSEFLRSLGKLSE